MKWEYRIIRLSDDKEYQEAQLNTQGKAGWGLVCVSDGLAYLIRQVFDEDTNIRFVEKRDTEEGAELVGHEVACCTGSCNCMCMAECAC